MPTAWESRISSLNPVFWLKFDGTGLPTNSGSNGATVTLGNGSHPSATTALSNTGYTFTTTNAARYDISTFAANTLSDKIYTIETVFKITPGTTNAYQTIFRSDNGNNSIILRVPGSGAYAGRFEIYLCGNSGTGVNYFSSTRVDDGSYHHAALVADGANMHLYIDGFRHQIAAYPNGTLNLDTAGSRFISNAPGEISHNLTIDEFVIHNSALSATDIYNNMKTVLPTLAELSKIGGYTTTRPLVYVSADESENNTIVYNTAGSASTKSNTTSGTLTKTSGGGPGTVNLGYYGTTPSGWNNGFALGGSYGSFAIGWWFKRVAAPPTELNWNPQWYFDSGNNFGDSSSGTGWALKTDGTLLVRIKISSTLYALNTTSSICNNTWKHIIVSKNGTTLTLYVNGVAEASTTITSAGLSSATTYYPYINNTTVATSWDQFFLYPAAISASQANDLYVAGFGGVDLNYTNTSGATASATMPEATWSATTVINNTYNSGVLGTASADIVNPVLQTNVNLDAFGFMSVDPALFVDPDISVDKNNDYAADPSTASALMTAAVITTTRAVNYSASPATVSALFGGNVFAGQTVQDTNYEFNVRRFNSVANQAVISQSVDANMASGIWTPISRLAIKQVSGVPTYNQIIKARLRVDSPFYAYATNLPNPRFNIYVFTSNPKNGKTFNTMLEADMPDKELLYTTRTADDLNNGTGAEDLTQSLQDSRAATYGIMIELAEYDYNGNSHANGYYAWTWAAANYNEVTKEWFYILTSEFVSANINAAPMIASANATTATVDTQRYVNFQNGVATATADSVMPTISVEDTNNYLADPATASALAVQPTLDFSAVAEASPMIAFADTYAVVVSATKNVNYQATVNTVAAELHMPQAQIGENNSVDHMNASALFVNPLVIINESVDAMVTTATATMVNSTVAGQLLGVVFASPMRANAMAPNPPGYIDLFSDPWYASLYAQHSVRHGAPYGKAFLKLFEDQNTDITQSTPNTTPAGATRTLRQLRNNLTNGIVNNTGPENDASIPNVTTITDYSTAENESRLSVGYFDPYGRKAIRLQNVAINIGEKYGYSKDDFSLEFSIKTTKADQVIAHGTWNSATSYGRVKTTYNLVDGKLNYMTYAGSYDVFHPKMTLPTSNFSLWGQLTGNKRIDDGQWHHIIIQYTQGDLTTVEGTLGRFQIWIDGKLDIQRFEQNPYDIDFVGANMNSIYASDFYTSAYSMDAPAFVSERDMLLHYYDYIKYEPILAEPMTASLRMTQDNNGFGNRGRMLMLYWWPTSSGQNKNLITSRFDSPYYSSEGEFDINMFDNDLQTIDFIKNPPQQYYGWDVFPVDITGYFVSDLVKEEAYGGAQNIVESDLGGAVGPYDGPRPKFKANRRGYFRNTLDDTRRYIDLVNDIDLSKFDAIGFKNYPDQSNEVDAFARNEIVDPYFNIRETKIYQDFIKSLRAAVDTGISLMVNNPQLALDLKIVDRIEVVPDLTDGQGNYSDPYTPTIVPSGAAGLPVSTGSTSNLWTDTYRNNRIRVINTVPGVTDERSIIYTDAAYWNNDDTLNYGGANRPFKGFTYKPNGLSIGDEFFISTFNFGNPTQYGGGGSVSRNYLATPIANVLAGTPVTAFANQYRRGLNLVDNPYKNHVTSIAIKPGDVLDGRQVGGKIWVNFTDAINQENDYVAIDAIHSNWINLAYQEGSISLELRNQLLASEDLLENKLNNNEITQQEYNSLSRWSQNGMYILASATQLEIEGGKSDFSGDKLRTERVTKSSKGGLATSRTVSFGGQFFAFTYARQFLQLGFEAISMNTRGWRWLSNRVAEVDQSQAHTAMPASAQMVQPTVTAVKYVTVNAQSMVANAIKIPAVGFAGNNVNVLSLPMNATAVMTSHVKMISAAVMTATANFREQSVIRTTATDQIIVYVLHEDPILYLREDIIK